MAGVVDLRRFRAGRGEPLAPLDQVSWGRARPASPEHPHLLNHDVKPFGIRQVRRRPRGEIHENGQVHLELNDLRWDLVIPARDERGRNRNLQLINPDGFSSFTAERVEGLWHLLGEQPKRKPLLIAEEYVSAASLHEATGWPVACAFFVWNIPAVARRLRGLYPKTALYAATTDALQPLWLSRDVRASTGHRPLVPVLDRPGWERPRLGLTSWNDYHRHHGLKTLNAQVRHLVTQPQAIESSHDE